MIRSLTFCLTIGLFTTSAWAQESIALPIQEPISSLVMQGAINIDQLRRPTVGKLGRPDSLVFEGQKTFSAEKIRRALAKDFDVVLASDAHANLRNYLKILRRRLSEGYRKAGFPEVKISATLLPEKGQIKIKIEEGPRYKNGAVVIKCPDAIDRQVMRRYLTKGEAYKTPQNTNQVAEEKAETSTPKLWIAGKTANFWEKPEKVYRDAIKAGLKAQGYFYPEFKTTLKPDETGLVQLWIQVTDPGPKATIGTITVEGLKHHTKEQLLEYLAIKPGLHVDYAQTKAWKQKLRESRCFLESDVAVMPAIGPGAPSELFIRVKEQPLGPFLGESLTEQDVAIAKTSDWMKQWNEGNQGDLVIVARGEDPISFRCFVIASPKNGILFDVELIPIGPGDALRYTLLVAEDHQRLVSWHRKQQLHWCLPTGQFLTNMRFDFAPEAGNDESWKLRSGVNIGYHSNRPNNGNPFGLRVDLPAEVAIAAARNPKFTVERKDGIISFANEKIVRIDAETGAIIDVMPRGAKINLDAVKSQRIPRLDEKATVAFIKDAAFAKVRTSLEQQAGGIPSAHNPQRPVSSFLEFYLAEFQKAAQLAGEDSPVDVYARLLELDAIRPLDRLWIEWQADSEENDFSLPWSSEDAEDFRFFGLEKKLPLGLGKQLARVTYGLHGLFVPPESGPAKVGWNLALLCTGRFGQASRNLKILPQAPEVGPLTCWYAGRVFGLLDKSTGKKFASSGLEKLDAKVFHREMDHMLPAESLLFELVGSVGNAVRQLDDDEFAQLALLLGEASKHPAVPKLARKLRQEQGTPSRKFLLEAIVTLWNIRGRDYVKARLEEIAARPVLEPTTDSDSRSTRKGKRKSQIK